MLHKQRFFQFKTGSWSLHPKGAGERGRGLARLRATESWGSFSLWSLGIASPDEGERCASGGGSLPKDVPRPGTASPSRSSPTQRCPQPAAGPTSGQLCASLAGLRARMRRGCAAGDVPPRVLNICSRGEGTAPDFQHLASTTRASSPAKVGRGRTSKARQLERTPDPLGGRGVLGAHRWGAGGWVSGLSPSSSSLHVPTKGRLHPARGGGDGGRAWRGWWRDGKGDGGEVEVLGAEARSTPGL